MHVCLIYVLCMISNVTGGVIMAEVGKLKALFESNNKVPTPEPKAPSPIVIHRTTLAKNESNRSEGISTPWGIKLRPVNMVRSRSVHSMCNKRENEPIIRTSRSGSTGNEIDESSLPLPSHLFQKGLRTARNTIIHDTHSTNKIPNGRPPLAPKPAKKCEKSINLSSRKPTRLKDQHSRSVDCLADYGKEQEVIGVYPQSPVFPRKSTSPSKEEASQASPAANSLSPTSQRSSLQDADTIQEDRPVTVQEEAKERSGTIEGQQKYESPLYLRRKPQSPVLVQNMEQISSVIAQQSATTSTPGSDSTPVVSEDCKKRNALSPDAKHNSGASTPLFSGSPLMSSQMIEEIFERSKSALDLKVGDVDSGDMSPHQVLEYSCSPSKILGGSKVDSEDEDEDDSSKLFGKKSKTSEDKDELMFAMEYNKNSLDTDSGNQLRISDVSSEYEGMSRSPIPDSGQNGSKSPSPPGNEKLSKVIIIDT